MTPLDVSSVFDLEILNRTSRPRCCGYGPAAHHLPRDVLQEGGAAALPHLAGFDREVDAEAMRPALARLECIGSSSIAGSLHALLLSLDACFHSLDACLDPHKR
jgi:hypothetical protein